MLISRIITSRPPTNSTTPRLDLELLLTKALNKPKVFLYQQADYELSPMQEKNFNGLYQRYLAGEPIAYILGKKEFWSLELMVNKNVLIPRPETELLVEIILQQLDQESATIADLGTGSGAIALALASERPNWSIIATDISLAALEVARYNAMKLQIPNVEFCYSDWGWELPQKKFDVIVSNPPYIAEDDPHLKQAAIKFEPKLALVAGDGLAATKIIVKQAQDHLKADGWLLLEHGYDQNEAVTKILWQNNYRKITSYQDLAGRDRAILAKKIDNQ